MEALDEPILAVLYAGVRERPVEVVKRRQQLPRELDDAALVRRFGVSRTTRLR